MRMIGVGTAAVAATLIGMSPAPRANFLDVSVSAPRAVTVRAIWHPYQGAATFQEQQAAILRRPRDPDSLRRWRDPNALDTVTVRTPTGFVIDMNGGPVVIETTGDSILVEAQLAPARGRRASAWGKKLIIESDGIAPNVTRAPR